jgi:hypothetical protein
MRHRKTKLASGEFVSEGDFVEMRGYKIPDGTIGQLISIVSRGPAGTRVHVALPDGEVRVLSREFSRESIVRKVDPIPAHLEVPIVSSEPKIIHASDDDWVPSWQRSSKVPVRVVQASEHHVNCPCGMELIVRDFIECVCGRRYKTRVRVDMFDLIREGKAR